MHKSEPAKLIRRWAQQAKEIIDVDYLLERFINQEAGWSMEVRVRKWRALAIKLGIANFEDEERDMLLRMLVSVLVLHRLYGIGV